MNEEFEFFVKSDLQHLAGKWIAIFEDKILASGDSFTEVANAVENAGIKKKPLFVRVPSKLAEIL